jgi:hypothetical protein
MKRVQWVPWYYARNATNVPRAITLSLMTSLLPLTGIFIVRIVPTHAMNVVTGIRPTICPVRMTENPADGTTTRKRYVRIAVGSVRIVPANTMVLVVKMPVRMQFVLVVRKPISIATNAPA